MPARNHVVGLAAVLVLAACSGEESPIASSTDPAEEATTTRVEPLPSVVRSEATPNPIDAPRMALSTVSGPISGNRLVIGSSDLVNQDPLDVVLGGIPVWVVGVADAERPTWVVALESGDLEAWRLGDAGPEWFPLDTDWLPPGTPPLVVNTAVGPAVVSPLVDASPLSHPTQAAGRFIYITESGGLVIVHEDKATELAINALPDSRLNVSQDGLVSVLVEPTDRYRHGVLGDDIEAGGLLIIDPATEEVAGVAVIDEPSVIEGIAAPWVDVDGDGTEELLVTVSNGEVGARLAVFDRGGELIAQGPPIGRGNRWRNQLGVAPTGPGGTAEVIDVRVPHIGGVVEYFELDGSELVSVAEQSGFTSHRIGSRNLDMAMAADVTGDGRVDVIVPTNDLDTLGVLSRTVDGVDIAAELPLPGQLSTNVAGASLTDGNVAIAAGTSEGILRIYAVG
ncbi:MAG: hypothetical protein ACR2NG_07940 [Acidimicrobiia bacterium]